jgi:hypothetical protein
MFATDMLLCAFCSAVLVALQRTLKERCANMAEESVASFFGTCSFFLYVGSLFVLGRCARPYIYVSVVLEAAYYSSASMEDFSPTKVCANRRLVQMFLHQKNLFLRWYFFGVWVPTCIIFATLDLPSSMPPFLIVSTAVIYGCAAAAWVLELRRWRVRTVTEFKQHAKDHRRQQYIRSIRPALFHAYQRLAFSAALSPTLGPALLHDLPFDIAERIVLFMKHPTATPVAHGEDIGLHSVEEQLGLSPWATLQRTVSMVSSVNDVGGSDGAESACFVEWCDDHVTGIFGAATSTSGEWSYWCCMRWKTGGMADVDHHHALLEGRVEVVERGETLSHEGTENPSCHG